jgi:dihydrofolate synthase/folylpolyglutamate synthase
MSLFSTYDQVELHILQMPRFQDIGSKAANFKLDQIREFCAEIGNPQDGFKSVHVAGTNGKGTVCSMLSAIYTAAGYKTGLFSSPHLINVRERFRINGLCITEQDLISFFNENETALELHTITFFELTTAIAFWWFAREKVDIAIIETGLGGRLDATNIIHPEACIISSIGLDHTKELGNTLPQIASEKAGILKHGVKYTTGKLDVASAEVISKVAKAAGAIRMESVASAQKLHQKTVKVSVGTDEYLLESDVFSSHLTENIEMCIDTVLALEMDFPVANTNIIDGISNMRQLSGLKGRFERMHPANEWYFDGAHNVQALESLIETVALHPVGSKIDRKIAVVTLMQDKISSDLVELYRQFDEVYFVELKTPRAGTFEMFQKYLPNAKKLTNSASNVNSFLNKVQSMLVLFTGSFYFYSTVSEWMESTTLGSNRKSATPPNKRKSN